MAMSIGVSSAFLAGEPAYLASSSSSSLKFTAPAAFHANLRTPRTFVTYATASKPATETKKSAPPPRGITKPRPVSPEMMEFLGGKKEISRTLALKEIWAYIKEKELQDPTNKRVIVCDEKLKKIFAGKDRVGFLEVAGLITPHLLKVEN